MAGNTLTEPPYTAKSPYCWEMMRSLGKSRKENVLSDVTLQVEGQPFAARDSPHIDVFWRPVASSFTVYLPTI